MNESRQTVCMVTSSVSRQGGGVAEAVRQLASALDSEGSYSIDILTTEDGDLEKDLPSFGTMRVEAFPFVGPASFRLSTGLIWTIFRSDAALMHVHGLWASHGIGVLLWHLRTGRPYIISTHGMLESWILQRSKVLKHLVGLLYQNALLRRAVQFHALTEKEVHDVRSLVRDASVTVIPNAVVVNPRETLRPAWYKPEMEGRRIYLFLGRIHEKKGWRELCAAWSSLCKQDAAFAARSQLVFCGWLDGAEDFEAVIAEVAAQHGNAIFAGAQFGDEKAKSLSVCDVFVLPSKSEGLPMVILEAWAAGKPAMMTPECNLPIGFEHNAAFETGSSVEEIVRSLRYTCGLGAAELATFGQNGKVLIDKFYSHQAVGQQMTRTYQRAVERDND